MDEPLTATEALTKRHLEKLGYVVLRNGWPDFLVMTQDLRSGAGIEVKKRGDKLRESQVIMHKALARFGLRTQVVYDGEITKLDLGGVISLVSIRNLRNKLMGLTQLMGELGYLQNEIHRFKDQLDRIESALSEGN